MRRFRSFLARAMRAGQEQGVFRADVVPERAASVLMGGIMGAEIEHYQDPEEVDLRRVLDELIEQTDRLARGTAGVQGGVRRRHGMVNFKPDRGSGADARDDVVVRARGAPAAFAGSRREVRRPCRRDHARLGARTGAERGPGEPRGLWRSAIGDQRCAAARGARVRRPLPGAPSGDAAPVHDAVARGRHARTAAALAGAFRRRCLHRRHGGVRRTELGLRSDRARDARRARRRRLGAHGNEVPGAAGGRCRGDARLRNGARWSWPRSSSNVARRASRSASASGTWASAPSTPTGSSWLASGCLPRTASAGTARRCSR